MDAARQTFTQFSKYGDTKSDGTKLDNKKFSKICKDSKIINKACTSTDIDIVFSKVKTKGQRVIDFDQFCTALKELSKKRFPKNDNAFDKTIELLNGVTPGNVGTTKTSKTGGVAKMTDASGYTGAHKARFNADGSGAGLDGRVDRVENTGYVGNYKGDGTYDKKH